MSNELKEMTPEKLVDVFAATCRYDIRQQARAELLRRLKGERAAQPVEERATRRVLGEEAWAEEGLQCKTKAHMVTLLRAFAANIKAHREAEHLAGSEDGLKEKIAVLICTHCNARLCDHDSNGERLATSPRLDYTPYETCPRATILGTDLMALIKGE